MTTYDFNLITAFANSAPSNEIEPFPDYDRGLGIAFDETDGKPEMKGLNGLFSLMTVSLLALKQRGILNWTTGFEYKQGAFVVESNRLYQAKIDNTSKQPSLSQNEWQVWASVSDIDVDNNGNIIKTEKAGGAFTLKVNDASTTIKGVSRFATPTEVSNKSNLSVSVRPVDAETISKSSDLGVLQTWKKPFRQIGVEYVNPYDKPIQVAIMGSYDNMLGVTQFSVDNVILFRLNWVGLTYDTYYFTVIIPPKSKYKLDSAINLISWAELS